MVFVMNDEDFMDLLSDMQKYGPLPSSTDRPYFLERIYDDPRQAKGTIRMLTVDRLPMADRDNLFEATT
jgi:hypothetical protein